MSLLIDRQTLTEAWGVTRSTVTNRLRGLRPYRPRKQGSQPQPARHHIGAILPRCKKGREIAPLFANAFDDGDPGENSAKSFATAILLEEWIGGQNSEIRDRYRFCRSVLSAVVYRMRGGISFLPTLERVNLLILLNSECLRYIVLGEVPTRDWDEILQEAAIIFGGYPNE